MSLLSDLQKSDIGILIFMHLSYKTNAGVDLDFYFHTNGANESVSTDGKRIELNNVMTWNGNDYDFVGADISGVKFSDGGQASSPKLRVANTINGVKNFMSGLCVNYNNLRGAVLHVYLTTTLSYTAGTLQYKRQEWVVDRLSALNVELAEFELKSVLDFRKQKIPTRLVSPYCTWATRGQYRGESCGYTGSNYFDEKGSPVDSITLDKCGGLINDCQIRFGQGEVLNHGGFLVGFNKSS